VLPQKPHGKEKRNDGNAEGAERGYCYHAFPK
jgi:hypothetical protein